MTLCVLDELIHGIRLDRKKNKEIVEGYSRKLSVKTPSYRQKIKNLSGGNQQKVVLGKWLATKPKVLILDEPTRGIDVGAKQEIYQLIKEMADSGIGVILISSELPEIIHMSHRVVVMREMRQVGILEEQDIRQETIIRNALGG